MADSNLKDQEQQVKKLKRLLEGWRMALIPLKSIMLWEQQWYPCAVIGCLSSIFFFIWLLDLNTLTTIAVIGLLANFVDFIIPIICNSVCGPNSWTGQKEKMFEDICRSIVVTYNNCLHHIRSFYSMRDSSPCMYYVISISTLLTLAWVSSAFNNIFLVYIMSVILLLWPGIQHRGTFNTVLSMISRAPKSLKTQ